MGVRIGGVWHEELSDPGHGGSESGNGRSFGSMGDYSAAASGGNPVTNPTNPGPTTPAPTPTTPQRNNGGISDEDMQKLRAFFSQTSGFSREELAEKKRQFDATMAQQEQQWQREGLPLLEIKKRLADLEFQKFGEGVRQFNSTMGLDYLKTAASLGGPADYFQSVDFMRGARQRGDVPQFLDALSGATSMPAFTGPGSTPPTPQTAQGLGLQLAPGLTIAGSTPPAGAVLPAAVPGAPAAPAPAAPVAQSADDAVNAAGKAKVGNWDEAVFRDRRSKGLDLESAIWAASGNTIGSPLDLGLPQYSTNNYRIVAGGQGVKFGDPELKMVTDAQQPVPAAAAAARGLSGTAVDTGTPPVSTNPPTGDFAPGFTPTLVDPYNQPGYTPGTPGAPAPTAAATTTPTTPGGYSADAALQKIGSIFQRGPTGLAPGSLERLDPNELDLLRSGGRKLGYDPEAWLRAYSKAGIGQSAGAPV